MSQILVQLILGLIKLFIPVIKESFEDTNTTAVEESEGLTKRLNNSIRNHWGKTLVLAFLSLTLFSCGTRTVYVPDGTPVKFAETLKNVKVWVKTKDGKIKKQTMDIPEGWFAVPDPKK